MHHHRKLILNDSFRFLSLAWFSDEPCGLLIEVYSIVTRLHIILADDDPDECMIFTQCLEEVMPDSKITCVEDCKGLLAYLENGDGNGDGNANPDLVFLDLNMPLTSGQECLQKVIQSKFLNKVPIIVYSTASRANIVEECYRIGASMYVVKPSDTRKLRETIEAVVKRYVDQNN
jgi:CheY-like chemotaxis protein